MGLTNNAALILLSSWYVVTSKEVIDFLEYSTVNLMVLWKELQYHTKEFNSSSVTLNIPQMLSINLNHILGHFIWG